MWCFRSTSKFVYQLEAVTEAQPLLLEQHLKAANGSVVTVQHEHGQGGELARSVPTVATVHHHRGFPGLHLVCDPQCSCQDQLQKQRLSREAENRRMFFFLLRRHQCSP